MLVRRSEAREEVGSTARGVHCALFLNVKVFFLASSGRTRHRESAHSDLSVLRVSCAFHYFILLSLQKHANYRICATADHARRFEERLRIVLI